MAIQEYVASRFGMIYRMNSAPSLDTVFFLIKVIQQTDSSFKIWTDSHGKPDKLKY